MTYFCVPIDKMIHSLLPPKRYLLNFIIINSLNTFTCLFHGISNPEMKFQVRICITSGYPISICRMAVSVSLYSNQMQPQMGRGVIGNELCQCINNKLRPTCWPDHHHNQPIIITMNGHRPLLRSVTNSHNHDIILLCPPTDYPSKDIIIITLLLLQHMKLPF